VFGVRRRGTADETETFEGGHKTLEMLVVAHRRPMVCVALMRAELRIFREDDLVELAQFLPPRPNEAGRLLDQGHEPVGYGPDRG